ncbi:MAG: hypothetical protein KAR06_03715 [Deltaproteobacteria bacterium]|nr:hypothetical protein [Deltaproteobacteria bacterium]
MRASILVFLAILLASPVLADDRHHYSTTNVYTDSKGIASAISAAQCNFDNSSNALQICAAMGFSDGNQAQTAGIAKKYKGFLLNGTVSTESGQTRYGVGLTIKVK